MKSPYRASATVGALLMFALALNAPAEAQSTPVPETQPVPVTPAAAAKTMPATTSPDVRAAEAAANLPNTTSTQDATRQTPTLDVVPRTAKPVLPACTSLSCADQNRDGKLGKEELAALNDPTRTLQSLDTDGNGSVDELEWKRFEQINLPEPK